MADEWILKDYMGNAVGTTLDGGISSGTTVFAVVSGTGLPTGAGGPFVVTIDRLGTEEKVLVASRSGNTLTVQQRGYDGTAAVAHLTGVTLDHCFDAHSAKQANALSSVMDSTGSMAYRAAGFAFTELPIGTTGYPIVATATVPAYEQLDLAGLAAAVVDRLIPAGTVVATVGSTADVGYLFLDGSTVIAGQTLHPDLWGRIPAAWKSGADIVLPDARGRTIIGAGTGTGLTARVLADLVGNETHALATTELASHTHPTPAHAHSIGHDHPAVTSGDDSPDHGHTVVAVTGNGASGVAFLLNGAQGLNTFGPYSELGIPSTGATVRHQHAVDVGAFTGNTDTSGSGTSGPGGSGAAHNNMQPSLVLNYQIKAH